MTVEKQDASSRITAALVEQERDLLLSDLVATRRRLDEALVREMATRREATDLRRAVEAAESDVARLRDKTRLLPYVRWKLASARKVVRRASKSLREKVATSFRPG